MRKILIMAMLGVLATLGMAACGSVHHLTAKAQCVISFHSWEKGGGKTKLLNVKHTLEAVGKADQIAASAKFTPKTVAVMRSTSMKLISAVNALKADQPPACVPGLRTDVSSGLAEFSAAAAKELVAVNAATRKNATTLRASLLAASADFKAGGNAFIKVGHDITTYAKS